MKIELKIDFIDKKNIIAFDVGRTQPKLNAREPEQEHSAERNSTFGILGQLPETERVKVIALGGLLKMFRNAYGIYFQVT